MWIILIIAKFFQSPFHKSWQVMGVVFVCSYILLGIGSGWGLLKVPMAPNFWFAYSFTLTVCLSLTIYIHAINGWLSQKNRKHKVASVLAHAGLGILLPILFDLIAVEIFFNDRSESVFSNTFFDVDFILIVIYILLANAFYAYANHNLKLRLGIRTTLKHRVVPAFKDLAMLKALHRMEIMQRAPASISFFGLKEIQIEPGHIACAYKVGDLIQIHHFDQTISISKIPIAKIYAALDQVDYIKINPRCFHHRLLILSYEEISSSRRIYLHLRHPFNHLQEDQHRIVSQSLSVNFKKTIRF